MNFFKKTSIVSVLLLAFIHMGIVNADTSLSKCLTVADTLEQNECFSDKGLSSGTTVYRKGIGRNNVLQGIAFDPVYRILYTIHVTGKPEMGVINRFYDVDNKNEINALDSQLPSTRIGHQGIALLPKTDWLLSSAGRATDNKGRFISLFKYTSDNIPYDVKVIKVFGDDYDGKIIAMPFVTSDGNLLIVSGKKDGIDVIRVFDLKKSNLLSSNDISSTYRNEWEISKDLTNDGRYFQAMASDGKYVYLLSGNASQSVKKLYAYSLDGKLSKKIDYVTLGQTDALKAGNEGHWEPEGLAVDSKNDALLILFSVGNKGKRLGKIYSIKLQP
ncbi:MAG: hypothetical protein WAK61_16945 [Leclercia sp.]